LANYYVYVAAPDYEPIPENEAAPKAEAAAEKALAIDRTSADAHAALAAAKWSLFEFADADVEFRRTLELNPNLPNATTGTVYFYPGKIVTRMRLRIFNVYFATHAGIRSASIN
jgi:hypothetical protein